MTETSALPSALHRIDDLDEAWGVVNPGERLEAVRAAAPGVKARLVGSGMAVSVCTFDISSLPYPVQYGFNGVVQAPFPYLVMKNRMQLVQVVADGALVNILVNPTDPARAQGAPFIGKQLSRLGRLADRLRQHFQHGSVDGALASVGVAAADIDYITFDHLHVQDVRGLLGTEVPEPGQDAPTAALLPNAKLLVQRAELYAFENPHPQQRYWYVRDGIAGIARDKIVVLEGDYLIGSGVALVRTPGHTLGNHSPAINTASGVWTISENGIAVECYAPGHSNLRALRQAAREREIEVILNSNTREHSLDQYTSMILEKTLADPCAAYPEFPQHFPSSELQASPLAPGIRPTFSHERITHGTVVTDKAGYARSAA